jgi:hypothetical protein
VAGRSRDGMGVDWEEVEGREVDGLYRLVTDSRADGANGRV